MFKLAVEMVKCFDDLERQEHEISSKEFFQNRGAVLVFLPGLAEIEQLFKMERDGQWELLYADNFIDSRIKGRSDLMSLIGGRRDEAEGTKNNMEKAKLMATRN
ncbi:putative ATP-dependent RNA helicase TDRD9 [Portunus trituberculatus]|uniref:Putative ATP-dependent RNA helicase TDRD9 n=1 Tax=Portunus trituberculatus TaxID=210409 RepID=A0A5B7FWE2_PORTR|nr:putative ATP-dependent RNA helicase TDRD9 [Portunus trituberculatus]